MMMRSRTSRWWAAALMLLLCVILFAFWQRQALARLAIVAAVDAITHARLSLAHSQVSLSHALLTGVRLTSLRDEPIADIASLQLSYDLRDLLPGGRRLFGLKTVEADSPHLTIIRRPDGTYNVPLPQVSKAPARGGRPLIVQARVRDGSITIVDQSPYALPNHRRLRAADAEINADISSASRSTYAATLKYGERADRLYAVTGHGVIDLEQGYQNQRWTAAELPIAGAVNFALNSPSLRLHSGVLRNVDARYFRIDNANGSAHLAASASLQGCNIAVAGLAQQVTGAHGSVFVYDDGLLTPGIQASLGGVRTAITGGIYGLTSPRLRLAVRGSGDLAQLRAVFAQAKRLPMQGPIAFSLLAEGNAKEPLIWIALRSPQTTYAGTALQNLNGMVAFDGQEADIVGFGGAYGRVNLDARGRIAINAHHNAIAMLVQARSPAGATPFVSALLPQVPLQAALLATADNPKAFAARGALWGSGGTQSLDAIFNVDQHGNGAIGPLLARSGSGSLYARAELEHAGGPSVGVMEARDFPLDAARGTLSATLAGGGTPAGIAVAGSGDVTGSLGVATAHGIVAMRGGSLHGAIFGDLGSKASAGATIGGTPRSPSVAGTVVIAGGRYRNFNVNGNAGLAYENGTVDVHDAAVAVGSLFAGVSGTVAGLSPQHALAPRYDLAAQLHSADVRSLVAAVSPQKAPLVQGSVDANLRVRGSGRTPSFAGRVSAPEGSVNGLSFRDFAGSVNGDANALALTNGRVSVGSSTIALDARANRAGGADVALDAPRVDLADFNDFFDTGDTFAGTGSLALRAQTIRTRVLSTSGNADFSNARFRRLDLGTVAAHWSGQGGAIASALRFGGPSGEVAVNGTISPATRSVNLRADARRVDLTTWLPMLGYSVPITGRLNAQTSLDGSYPDLAMRLHAAVLGGTAGRLTIDRFEVNASALHGRGTIESASLDVPSMTTVASGTFGLRTDDPLALAITSTSSNVGDFLTRATGKDFGVNGTFSSTLRVEGTRTAPRLRDSVVLQNVRYRNLTIPRVAGEIDAERSMLAVRNGEVDFDRGKALISAAMPIRFAANRVTPGDGKIAASLAADDLELSNFAALLPKGTQISGRIDGRVEAGGTVAVPLVNGTLTLADGTLRGPIERSPITGIAGTLALGGTRAQLEARAIVGSAPLTASGDASLSDLRRPAEIAFALQARADNARLDLPGYFQGDLNGTVAVERKPDALPAISGDLAVSNARVPLNAFINQKSGGAAHSGLPNVAFSGLQVAVGPNVRVQSANVDIGATGAVRLDGTLENPALAGQFTSTGGSLSFYRSFNIERGNVTFDRSSGVIPNVDAVATTFIPDPATAVRLRVTGAVTNMNLAFESDPPYSKEQILGLLVGAQQIGAVRGVQSTGGGSFSPGSALQGVALGQVNTAFTRNLLEPLSASVGKTLGFSELQITSDLQTGLGINAAKAFGKYTRAVFTESFGYPRSQSVALEANPNASTGLRLSAYTAQGPTLFAAQPPPMAANVLNINPATSYTPITGSNGFAFSYLRRFP